MATILGLPLIVIIENNLYSEMTPISELVRVGQLAERGAAYGIASTTVDGNDPEAVAAAATVRPTGPGRAVDRHSSRR